MRTLRRRSALLIAAIVIASGALAAPAKKAAKPQSAVQPAATATAAPTPAPTPPIPPPPPPPELVRTLGGISEYRLANGLQLLLFPDPSKPGTTVNVTYKVGSRHEGTGEAGMAHLLEHLLFKGTPEFADIPGELTRRGMRFNGTTNLDRTNYFSSFNADEDTLAFALQLEANRMLRSNILQADLDKEMPVVRNELEIGENNPVQLLRQRVMSAAFRFHPYARPPIGTLSDVENVAIENLRTFYRQYYQPDNAVLMVGGQFDPARTLALIQQYFGALPRPVRLLREAYTVEPPQDGERTVVLRRVGGAPLLLAAYHVPGMAHPDCAALNVLGPLLAQPPGGSLYKTLVEGKLATQVFAGGCGGYDPGVFSVGAAYAAGADARELERQLLDEVEGRTRVAIKAEDVQRITAQFELGYRQILKTPETAVLVLSEAVAAGDWRLIFKLLEDVRHIKPEDVERVAKRYLQPSNRSLGRYVPVAATERVEVPRVAARDAGLETLKLDTVLAAGEAFDASPSALEARSRRSSLPGGARLALLPKQNRGDSVLLALRLRWADLPAVYQEHAAGLVGALISEGTARHNRQQLQDESVRLKGGFRIQAGLQGANISINAERDTLLPMLALVQEVLREPSFPAAALERLKTQALAELQAGARDSDQLRQEATRAHYNRERGLKPGDIGYQSSPAERLAQLRAITLTQVQGFYQRYWSANEADVAVVGSLPEEPALRAALDSLLAGWKKPEAPRFVRRISPYQPVAGARFDVQVADKANALLQMRQELRLSSRDEDYPALALANLMLGGSLDSRLAKRVRREEGLSYRVGSELQADRWDDSGSWSISTSFAPKNRERLLAIIQEEIARLLDDGFEPEELEHARNNALQGRLQTRGNDIALASVLLGQLETGETWEQTESQDQRLRALDLSAVNAALRRHLKPAAWVISTAGDYQGLFTRGQ